MGQGGAGRGSLENFPSHGSPGQPFFPGPGLASLLHKQLAPLAFTLCTLYRVFFTGQALKLLSMGVVPRKMTGFAQHNIVQLW